MKCKRCNGEKNQIKAGKTKSGSQKYKCKVYGKSVYAKSEEKEVTNERVEIIEMDELYSFVERKSRIYLITLVNRDNRHIVCYDVAYYKGWKRLQKLVDKAPKANSYYSDAYSEYSEVCYEGRHISLNNKSQTYTIEGVNSDLKHYIKAVLKIFVNAFNLFDSSKKIYPYFKSSFFFANFIQSTFGHSLWSRKCPKRR